MNRNPASIVANLTKEEYFQITPARIYFLDILKGKPPAGLDITDSLVGKWRGDEIVTVFSGCARQKQAVTEVATMLALGGAPLASIYKLLKAEYSDIGRDIDYALVFSPALQNRCFKAITGPVNWSSLTDADLSQLIQKSIRLIGANLEIEYSVWLATRFNKAHNRSAY